MNHPKINLLGPRDLKSSRILSCMALHDLKNVVPDFSCGIMCLAS